MISLHLHDGPADKKIVPDPRVVTPSPEQLQLVQGRLQGVVGSRLRVQEPIAIGGMATIFRLQHAQNGALFIAKVLHEELAKRPEVVESFRREALHAATVGGHPSAIPVFDSGMASGLFFLTMPFVEGEDLDKLLEHHGPMSREETLQAAAQISSVLCHAESHGITHCDVAPGNIRLDTFGRYRLMDFGISYSRGEGEFRPLGGTPLYTSPEVLRGETPDVRADLYSLALVLYEMLSGEPLLKAKDLQELRGKHLKGEWQFAPVVAEDAVLAKLLRSMLALNRNQRPASAFELSGALAALGYDRPEFRKRPARPEEGNQRRHRLS